MVVSDRKVNQLMVDEVRVTDTALGVVNAQSAVVMAEPLLSLISLVLIEGKIDSIVICWLDQRFELNYMTVDFSEVLLGLSGCRGTQTFVILYLAPA